MVNSKHKNGFGGKLFSRKTLIPVIIGIVAVVLAFAFLKDRIAFVGGLPVLKQAKKEEPKKQLAEIPIPIKAYKVSKVSFRDTLPSLGTIKGFREYDLKFATSGYIEYINFKEGEKITQGDIVASLDQKEQLLKLEYAKIESEKQSKLFELGSIIEAKLKQSQLEYQSAKVELDKTNLVASSDGYVGSIEVDKGSYVSPQDKIGTFVDVKDVYIEFGVIEKDLAKIKEGQNVEVVFDTYPDQVFKGQVDSVGPIVEGRTRTVKVRSKIANVDEKIKPGMFGRVSVLVYEKEQALVIPSSSFKKKEDQYFVYLVHPEEAKAQPAEVPGKDPKDVSEKKSWNPLGALLGKKEKPKPVNFQAGEQLQYGTVEVRNIEVNYATPDAIEVKEGLDEGDMVIVDVEQDLQDKSRVEISETQEGIF